MEIDLVFRETTTSSEMSERVRELLIRRHGDVPDVHFIHDEPDDRVGDELPRGRSRDDRIPDVGPSLQLRENAPRDPIAATGGPVPGVGPEG